MKKQKYAPTRNMRKQQEQERLERRTGIKRKPEFEFEPEALETVPATDGEGIPEAESVQPKIRRRLTKKEALIIAISLTLVVVLLIVTLILFLREPKLETDFPVAVITFDNGDGIDFSLDFILRHDLVPTAVENFVHLANRGVYNGTLVHRIEDGILRAGEWEQFMPTNSTANVDLFQRFKNRDDGQYKYSVLKKDDKTLVNTAAGRLCAKLDTSNGNINWRFSIVLDKVRVNTGSHFDIAFGELRKPDDPAELQKLAALANPELVLDGYNHFPWPELRIKSVTIKANDKKWRDYNFFRNREAADFSRGTIT